MAGRYSYYSDTLDRGLDPTYDMPGYTFGQWRDVSMVQRRARVKIAAVREHRRYGCMVM